MILQDDNDLMALAREGNKEAYSQLVRKHRVSAISFAYSILFNIYIAEDVVQDVFVNIYVKRSSYQPICEFKTFLYQAVRNRAIDFLRRNKIRATLDINDITELSKTCSAEEKFFQIENGRSLFMLINGLKRDYKTAIYLFAVEGASYEEIAEIMKKNISQVKILIFRARKKLKSQYREVLGDEK